MKLKKSINRNNLTLEDVKKILKFSTETAKNQMLAITTEIKHDRRKRFPKNVRNNRFADYLQACVASVNELQRGLAQLQVESGKIF